MVLLLAALLELFQILGMLVGVAFFGSLAHDGGGGFELFKAARAPLNLGRDAQAVAQQGAVGIGGAPSTAQFICPTRRAW